MSNNESFKPENMLGQRLIYFVFSVVVSVTAIVIVLNPGTVKKFIANADTAELLLKGYGNWYLTFWIVCITVLIFMAVFGIIALVFYTFKRKHSIAVRPVITLSVFIAFVFSVMLKDIDPHGQYQSYMEDVAAIREGNLISEEIHVNDNYEKAGLANHGKNYPKILTKYHATTAGTASGWNEIYVPDFMDFNLDNGHLYNENRNIEWNEEYAAIYRITYTPNYKVVTDIEIVQEGKDFTEE